MSAASNFSPGALSGIIRSKVVCALGAVTLVMLMQAAGHLDVFGGVDTGLAVLWSLARAWAQSSATSQWHPVHSLVYAAALWCVCQYASTAAPKYQIAALSFFIANSLGGLCVWVFSLMSWGVLLPLGMWLLQAGFLSVMAAFSVYVVNKRTNTEDTDVFGVLAFQGGICCLAALIVLWSYHERVDNRSEISRQMEGVYGSALRSAHVLSLNYDLNTDMDGRNAQPILAVFLDGRSSMYYTWSGLNCADGFSFRLSDGAYTVYAGDLTNEEPVAGNRAEALGKCMNDIMQVLKQPGA